ncbi:hypothetical protein AGLY_001024 [Aphis glycines]|uniref:Uncharacterized protein n=1 Tax=Aphis glycines TaxID=307491 RepID=A0A6G0U8M6_APHGL|nr:hypothetical protein AGLY_001024 [Aphis glycines]
MASGDPTIADNENFQSDWFASNSQSHQRGATGTMEKRSRSPCGCRSLCRTRSWPASLIGDYLTVTRLPSTTYGYRDVGNRLIAVQQLLVDYDVFHVQRSVSPQVVGKLGDHRPSRPVTVDTARCGFVPDLTTTTTMRVVTFATELELSWIIDETLNTMISWLTFGSYVLTMCITFNAKFHTPCRPVTRPSTTQRPLPVADAACHGYVPAHRQVMKVTAECIMNLDIFANVSTYRYLIEIIV